MPAKTWVVRCHMKADFLPESFLDSLRYARIIRLHKNPEEGQTFDIRCPKGIGRPKVWAEMNAKRMKSFGYDTWATF